MSPDVPPSEGPTPLPQWGDDPLGRFITQAENNGRITAIRYPSLYNFLGDIHTAYERVGEAVQSDDQEVRFVPRMLMVRTRAAVLAAIRVALSGHLYETFPLLRVAIEQAWYALHIAKDPRPPHRGVLWLKRDDDKEARSRCQSEFRINVVRASHEAIDPQTAEVLRGLYDRMIDFGAHPNQLGLLMGAEMTDKGDELRYDMPLLCVDTIPLLHAIRMVAAVAIGCLHVFIKIFPERFRIVGLDREIDRLSSELNRVFLPLIPKDDG